jgi:hypothetical protein
MVSAPIFAALIGTGGTLLVAIVAATWHISEKLSELRVLIEGEKTERIVTARKVNTIWRKCFGLRPRCIASPEPFAEGGTQ